MPSKYQDFVALARKRFQERQAENQARKQAGGSKQQASGPFQVTRHAEYKMRQYQLSLQRVRNVIRNPRRTEKGIVPKTIAVMQPVSVRKEGTKETWKQEIWVMYVKKNQESRIKNQARGKNIPDSPFSIHSSANQQIRIISAWRYPGVSPKRDPIPEDILRELLEGSILEGEA